MPEFKTRKRNVFRELALAAVLVALLILTIL